MTSMMDLAKGYKIHIILFVTAVVIYLSTSCSLHDWDDYQYFFGAKSILQNYTYLVDGNPSQYPMGYSLLIVPFFCFLGINAQSAVYPCAILGAFTVVLLYEFVKDLFDTRGALFASLFLIFGIWSYSTVIMSEVPALFFFLLGIFAVVKYANTEKAVFIYLFYFAAGFACLIRYTSGLMFVIMGLYIILSNKLYLLKRKEVWIGTFIFLLILSPQLIYNHIHFGSIFRTGYGGLLISETVERMVCNHRLHNTIRYIQYLVFGFGSPLLPFYLYGMWDLIKRRNREILSLIIPWITLPLLFFSYCYYPRYINSVLPALLILSGLGFSKMCDKLVIEAKNNRVKPDKSPFIQFKTIKIVLIILLVVILLVPTAMNSFNNIQEREARIECQKETFTWIRKNCGDGDIILSHPEPSYEYYSHRKVHSLRTSHNELKNLISTHNTSYLVINNVWRNRAVYAVYSDTEQWLKETYGLTHLKTFECKPKYPLISQLKHDFKRKAGISAFPPTPVTDRWDIYLIAKAS